MTRRQLHRDSGQELAGQGGQLGKGPRTRAMGAAEGLSLWEKHEQRASKLIRKLAKGGRRGLELWVGPKGGA